MVGVDEGDLEMFFNLSAVESQRLGIGLGTLAGVGERIDVGDGTDAGRLFDALAGTGVVVRDALAEGFRRFRSGFRPFAAGQEMAKGAVGADGDFVDGFVAHGGKGPKPHVRDSFQVAAAQEEGAAGIQHAGGDAKGAGEPRFAEGLGGIDDAVLAAALEQEQQRLVGQRMAAGEEGDGVVGRNGAVARGVQGFQLFRQALRRGIDFGRAFADAGVGEGHEPLPVSPGFGPAFGEGAALQEWIGREARERQDDEPLDGDRQSFHISDLLRVPQPVSANVSTAIGSCQTSTNM